MEFVFLEFMNVHHIPDFLEALSAGRSIFEVMNFGGYGLGIFNGSPTLTKSHPQNIRMFFLSLQLPSQIWIGPSQIFGALKRKLSLLSPGMGSQT